MSVTFLQFDTKLIDERSSVADNDSGSPLIYRVFLPTFVQPPTEMPFGASPVPKMEVAKIFFYSMATEMKLLNVDITFDFWFSKVTSALYPQKRIVIWRNIYHGKIKLQ